MQRYNYSCDYSVPMQEKTQAGMKKIGKGLWNGIRGNENQQRQEKHL